MAITLYKVVQYDGEEIDNEGGDTTGKSMNAYVMDW